MEVIAMSFAKSTVDDGVAVCSDEFKEQLCAVVCSEPGSYMTRERAIILDHICELSDVIDVDDLWITLRETHHISRASVYNVVRVLVRHGFITKSKKKNQGYIYYLT